MSSLDDKPVGGGGGYHINWDEFDETSNPFQSTVKMMNSPPHTALYDNHSKGQDVKEDEIQCSSDVNNSNSCEKSESKTLDGISMPSSESEVKFPPRKKVVKKAMTAKDPPGEEQSPKKQPKKIEGPSIQEKIKEMRRLKALQNQVGGEDVVILGVSKPENGEEGPAVVDSNPSEGVHGEDSEVMKDRAGVDMDATVGVPMSTSVEKLEDVLITQKTTEEFVPVTDEFKSDFFDELERKETHSNTDNALTRESLFVKFDPLAAKPNSQSPLMPIETQDVVSEESRSEDIASDDSLNLMDVVTPQKKTSPPKLTQQGTFDLTPQQPSPNDVDNMFRLTPQLNQTAKPSIPAPVMPLQEMTSHGDHESGKHSNAEVDRLKQQMQMDHQSQLLNKERQWEEKVRSLETDSQRINEEKEKLQCTVDEMKKCIEEYARTLQQIMDEKKRAEETSKDSVETIIEERDQAIEDLSTVEKAFGDLHRRFEKSKEVIDSFKKNETTLKQCMQDYQNKLKRHEQKYHTLKQHAEEKLKQANEEIETVRHNKEAEVTRLQAALKRAELQSHSLENQLGQKTRENEELAKICDELISKCGK